MRPTTTTQSDASGTHRSRFRLSARPLTRWRHQSRPRRIGQLLIAVGIIAILALALSPSPYAIEQPGPVYNTIGVDTAVGSPSNPGAKAVLTVKGARTYPTKGSLDMLTVGVLGDPSDRLNWSQVISAWFDHTKAVVPLSVEYPPGQSVEETNQLNAADMTTSQQDATAAALSELGYTITEKVVVAQVMSGSPASGRLKADDTITSVNGTAVASLTQLVSLITQNGTSKPATIGVERGKTKLTVSITPQASNGKATIGVYVGEEYNPFPVDVSFQLADVGGPSAGQMFALGIIDKLTPGYLNGGADVAGTGTIDAGGNIGAIGGIQQKMYGARSAGATIFLAPKSNCDEVTGHIPAGLHVYAVSTLKDSLAVLKAVSSGSSTASLPTCPAH